MNILAFDTCFNACSAAAGRAVRSLTPSFASVYEEMSVGHAERLMPMIRDVMADARLAFEDLNIIAVTHGPGTFTGTRIAVSAARALALATGADVVAVSSLRLMAMNPGLRSGRGRVVAIATDARRGEVYLQLINRHSLAAIAPPQVVRICDAAAALGPGPIEVAGSGAKALAAQATADGCDATCVSEHLLPDAFDMVFAAMSEPRILAPEPLYLRPPDAIASQPGRLQAGRHQPGRPQSGRAPPSGVGVPE